MVSNNRKTIENMVMDTGFALKGDFDSEIVVAHDIVDDVWVLESYISGKLTSSFILESFDLVMKYLVSKEATLLPSLGDVYDDIIFAVETKCDGVFYADSKAQVKNLTLEVVENLTLIK